MRQEILHPAFRLSRVSYFADFALAPAAIVLLLAWCPFDLQLPLRLAAGVLAWTLAEYLIHRVVFHGGTPLAAMHQVHHQLPKDMIGVASWGTFAGFAVVALLFGAAFAAGFMVGYLAYCALHVRIHHGDRARFGRYVGYMARLHSGHHRGGHGNFGVTSPLWDFCFRTLQRSGG